MYFLIILDYFLHFLCIKLCIFCILTPCSHGLITFGMQRAVTYVLFHCRFAVLGILGTINTNVPTCLKIVQFKASLESGFNTF